jgi:hypothetical protein
MRISASSDDVALLATYATEEDTENLIPAVKSCIRKAFKAPQPWVEIANLLGNCKGQDHPQDKIIGGQARNGSKTLETILTDDAALERAATDAATKAYLRAIRGGSDAPEPRAGAMLMLSLLLAAVEETQAKAKEGTGLAEWMSKPHAEDYVREEILSKGVWVDDYDLFIPMDCSGAWGGDRTRIGVEQTADDLCKVAEACYGHAIAVKGRRSVNDKGEESIKPPPGLTKESLSAAIMMAIKSRKDAAIFSMRQELEYNPEATDKVKELFEALFVRRWKIRGHEAITDPACYGDNAECKAKDLARLRLDLCALRQMLWQAKRAAYGLMGMDNLNGRILVNIYSRIGSIGKSYFLQQLFGPFIAARLCESVDFRHVSQSRFSSSLYQLPVLILEELDIGEGDDKDTSRIKTAITRGAIMGEDKHREATRKRTHATLIATANSPLSVILAQADEAGSDSGIGRRFWEWELEAISQSGDDHSILDLDGYDWKALWKSVDENREKGYAGTNSDMSREQLAVWGATQQQIVNTTWFDRHIESLGVEEHIEGEDIGALKIAKLDELVLRQLKAEHLVSNRMMESSIRRLIQKWVGARSLTMAKSTSGASVILVNPKTLTAELLKPGYLLGGRVTDLSGVEHACYLPEQPKMGAR